jgi:xanthine/CO dehydrogenase XdhC/CoxF family maturation factor
MKQAMEVMPQIPIDQQTVFVFMTHNYNYDRDMLHLLLQKECTYCGTLGSGNDWNACWQKETKAVLMCAMNKEW